MGPAQSSSAFSALQRMVSASLLAASRSTRKASVAPRCHNSPPRRCQTIPGFESTWRVCRAGSSDATNILADMAHHGTLAHLALENT